MAAVFKPGEDNKRPGEYVEVELRPGSWTWFINGT